MADDEVFPLIPDPEPGVSPEDDLAAAEASLLGPADGGEVNAAPRPFGRTPLFDFERGRFVRAGGSPVWVTGIEALKQRLLMAAYTERFRHRQVFSAAFGMEDREGPIGEAANIREAISDWAAHLAEAWLAIDRVVAVEDVDATWVPEDQAVYVGPVRVVTDDENDEFKIGPFAVAIGEA